MTVERHYCHQTEESVTVHIAALLAAITAGSIPLTALAALTASRLLVSSAGGVIEARAALTASRLVQSGSDGLLAVLAAITADRALISDGSGFPTHSTLTATQLAAAACAVTDTATIDLTLAANSLSASVIDGSISSAKLAAQAAGNASSSGFGGAAAIASTSYTSIQTASISPKTTTSKITVQVSAGYLHGSGNTLFRISRSSALVGAEYSVGVTTVLGFSATETPGTTSSITYSLDVKNDVPAGAAGSGQITLLESV